MNFDQLYQEYLDLDDPDYTVSLYDRLKWFYDNAHRHGREQAKREAARDVARDAEVEMLAKQEAELRRICGEG